VRRTAHHHNHLVVVAVVVNTDLVADHCSYQNASTFASGCHRWYCNPESLCSASGSETDHTAFPRAEKPCFVMSGTIIQESEQE
jgi:hypothetical protein